MEVGANSKFGVYSNKCNISSLRKYPTCRDATIGFCERRLEFHTDDSASDCLKICFNQSETLPMPDPGTVASSEEISALVPRSSFCRETSGGVTKCQVFAQAKTSISVRLRLQTFERAMPTKHSILPCDENSDVR